MADFPLRILQLSTADLGGGAERIAWNLHRAYQSLALDSVMAVGHKRSDDPAVYEIPNDACANFAARACYSAAGIFAQYAGKIRGADWFRRNLRIAGDLHRQSDWQAGIEDFNHPGTRRLPGLAGRFPDLIHAHNLHGGYFDLRELPRLSQEAPVVLTLHDAWLLSGHCGHSMGCDRWKTGCGHCPDLTIPPSIQRDATAENWRRKRDIFNRCQLHIITPSQWLMDKVVQSILSPAIASSRVIPNGVDLEIFHPRERTQAREQLGIDPECRVILLSANFLRSNPFKDYPTMRAALGHLARKPARRPQMVAALGDGDSASDADGIPIRFVPFLREPTDVARWYRASDLYLHGARADTFPNTVIEALACGTPVVASAVGGIPEQIHSLANPYHAEGHIAHNTNTATGILVIPADPEAMAGAIHTLLEHDDMRVALGANAVMDARSRFSLDTQIQNHLEYYLSFIRNGPPLIAQGTAR